MSSDLLPALPFVRLNEASAVERALTPVQASQLRSALLFHTLRHPGATVEARVTIGDLTQVPALTDLSTGDSSREDAPLFIARAQSRAFGTCSHGTADVLVRHIRISHKDATPATTQPPAKFSLPRNVYRALERRVPVVLDSVREGIMRWRERAIKVRLPRFPDGDSGTDLAEAHAMWDRTPNLPPQDTPRAILFGLHWLQTGGAERWAIESIQLAKDAGFLPIVITDQNSVHPWSARPELDGCIVITLSFSEHRHTLDLRLVLAILENYDIRGIVVHHCQWLYHSLPWISRHRPDIPVVDSLHIIEYLGGGYPGSGVHFDEFIDLHHVISPQLADWLVGVQEIDAAKVILAPLTTLTVAESQQFRSRAAGRPFTIAFLGRLSRQKRPDLFIALVRELRKQGLPFHSIMHGDGEMRDVVSELLERYGLTDIIEQRYEDTLATQTLAASDLLVVTSINEGLTLTTFEAIGAGIPVLSTDVGSQRTIVQGKMLLARPAIPFLRAAVKQITILARSDSAREHAWNTQRHAVEVFGRNTDAHHWMKDVFNKWQA